MDGWHPVDANIEYSVICNKRQDVNMMAVSELKTNQEQPERI